MYWVKCSRLLAFASIVSHQIKGGLRLWCIILFTEEHKAGFAHWRIPASGKHTIIILVIWVGTIITFLLWVYWWIMKCLREPTKKNFKKDFYTYIHINTLIQRYIRNELSARFCNLILNSMPLQELACHFWWGTWGCDCNECD